MRVPLALVGLIGCGDAELRDRAAELCASCDATCRVDHPRSDAAQHVSGGVAYEDVPPAGGDHDGCWAEWGVHATDPGDEHWVHNLEHGGVVFLYRCPEGCPDEIAALEAEVLARPTTILAPYDALPTTYAAVAWEHRLLTDCFDLDALLGFHDLFVDQAPESVAAGPSNACMTATP